MSAAAPGRFPWIPYAVVLAAIVLFAVFPLISVYIVYLIAEPNGCRVDEAGVYPCVINGTDYGTLLASLGLLGWLMLATIPLGALGVLIWLVVLIVHLLYRRHKAVKTGPTQ